MALKQRRTPDAINRPLLIIGVERKLFLAALAISFGVMVKIGFHVGLVTLVVMFVSAKAQTLRDELYFEVVLAAWNFPRMLDCVERRLFQVIITNDKQECEE